MCCVGLWTRTTSRRGTEIATYLMRYWITRATTEGVRWLDELLAAGAQRGTHSGAYFVRGFLAVLQSDPAAAVPALERVCARSPRDGTARGPVTVTVDGVDRRRHGGGPRVLEAAARRRLGLIADGLGDLGATLMLHQAQALNGLLDGDLAVVGPAAAEGARLSREAGDVYSLEMMLMNQALAAVMSGDLRECELRSTEGLRIADQLDDRVAQCYLLGRSGVLRGGPGRAPASRAAPRSDGQRPRRSRGEHPRRPRSGTGPSRQVGERQRWDRRASRPTSPADDN